ncbi:MAG: glycosyltransferase [Lachnospiraceae bacterium]|nr:glycosyltransferase [Lachnospiraceae bacterium]
MNDIKVSIVTVCKNSGKTIEKTIRSVLCQTYKNIEYIIKDGGSEDDTLEICRRYEGEFEKNGMTMKILSSPDSGIYDAMNRGIDETTGDIVGILNSDDSYEKETVEIMVQAYLKEDFDLAFGDIRMVLPSGRTFVKKARLRAYTTSRDWNHPTQFVKRSIYDTYRYRCENISDDMDLYFRIKKDGKKIIVINKVLAEFMMGGVSSTIPLHEVGERIMRRYRIYRQNGYSALYFFECAGFEIVKYVGSKF